MKKQELNRLKDGSTLELCGFLREVNDASR